MILNCVVKCPRDGKYICCCSCVFNKDCRYLCENANEEDVDNCKNKKVDENGAGKSI